MEAPEAVCGISPVNAGATRKMVSPEDVKKLVRDLWMSFQNPTDENEARIKMLLPILAAAAGPEVAVAAQAAIAHFEGACATCHSCYPRLSLLRFRGFSREVRRVVDTTLGTKWTERH